MAAAYCGGEEEVWRCPKHPSKRRRNGICATCLRDRLVILCPRCAQVRPCPCLFNSTSSSSSSASSSSSSVAGEPSLRRSRSLAIPFLRSNDHDHDHSRSRTPSFLSSVFRRSNTKRISESEKEKSKGKGKAMEGDDEENNSDDISNHRIEDFARLITRSRSVSASTSVFRRGDVGSAPAKAKAKFWRFPMKIFRG